MLFTYLISLLLLIDQGLFNLLIISQSLHNQTGTQTETQIRYVGFQTIGRFPNQLDYNEYIQKETT